MLSATINRPRSTPKSYRFQLSGYAMCRAARQVSRSGSDVITRVGCCCFRSAQGFPSPAAAWSRDCLLRTRQEPDFSQPAAGQARIFHVTGAHLTASCVVDVITELEKT